ncbi:MAG: threonine aldolase [Flavobacteriales bacterium]|jgi:threonine aldolase
MTIIELRSDTFTKPSKEMLNSMFAASVGDDVWDEDFTVKALEKRIALIFGMEAALFCPSGTMANQIAIKVHTQAGDEVICDYSSHIYQYEAGGIAFNSSASVNLLQGTNGKITVDLVQAALKEENIHFSKQSLVSVENTTNKGGGACYELSDLQDLSTFCKAKNLAFHMDGARLYNAIVKTKTKPSDYGSIFDSISVCMSKGLGAPIGSLLIGNNAFIAQAKRVRKVLGGGMRQAGYLAAACDYALNTNIDLLQHDHRRAKEIETTLKTLHYVKEVLPVETNIVVFSVTDPTSFVQYLKEKNILCSAISATQIRFVTHLQFTDEMLEVLVKALLNWK